MAEQSISKNRIGQIRSLHQKKFREESRLFIAEGRKVVAELLASGYEVKSLVATESYFSTADRSLSDRVDELLVAKEEDFSKLSALSTPQDVLAVARIPSEELKVSDFKGKFSVLLDDVRDPGNLGTILRIAHWFGAAQVVTSLNSVDAYNPKVVQASMGSLFHVPVHAIGLEGLLTQIRSETDIPVYAALMEGEDLYHASLTKEGILIFGNESMGIRTSLQELSHRKITIPSGELVPGNRPESLNVAISAALVLAAFRHQA
ncbi:MAG: hypothetical protein RL021_2255 [Bacteroidota bacterium]